MDPASAGMTGLSAAETRVLGCLLEKQRTTPDVYPLSLNSLRLACNQATNRDPVVDYDEATIRDALHHLERRKLVRFASGSRAAKYRHLLEEMLPLQEGERAVLTVLLLRGTQTPGELKQRTERIHAFAGLAEVHETLEQLIGRELVRRLDRRPGQKEARYEQLLQGGEEVERVGALAASGPHAASQEAEAAGANGGTAVAGPSGQDEPPPASGAAENPQRKGAELQELRERVERLEREVAELRFAMRNASPSTMPEPEHDPSRFDPRL
jgi:uncharacterized protein YceH (UPF0502 family)